MAPCTRRLSEPRTQRTRGVSGHWRGRLIHWSYCVTGFCNALIFGDWTMRPSLICALLLALVALHSRAQEAAPGFTPLFNGKDLAGWDFLNCNDKDWAIEDGVLSTRPG